VRTDGLKPAPNSVCAKRPNPLPPLIRRLYGNSGNKTKTHQSTSSDEDNNNNNNNYNSDNGNNDNKNSKDEPKRAPSNNNQQNDIAAQFKDMIAYSDPDDARHILSCPAIHNCPKSCSVLRFS
jgi:hypothetical protein